MKPAMPQTSDDAGFSLVAGGLSHRLLLRTGLTRDPVDLVHRRAIVLPALAWLPAAVLALASGLFLPGSSQVPFLNDIEAHVRLLVVLPLLLVAEIPVHERLGRVLRQFIARNYVPPDERPKFEAAVASAVRLRDAPWLELGIFVLVCTAGHWLWRSQVAHEGATWYATPVGLTLPGYWYAFVGIPLFQFIGFRWYMRCLIWIHLLWQISRLRLHLIATHPDRSAGLGFVGNSIFAFAPLLFAHGALLSGWIADRVFQDGRNALDFQVDAAVLIGGIVAVSLLPFCMFMPLISAAKRRCRREYGLLAAQYSEAFERKWVLSERPAGEPLLGNADMSGLADLGQGYMVVQETRLVPFGVKHITNVAIITAAPLLPLAFTIWPFGALIKKVLSILV
jgi:hypothetical protein